MDAERPVTNTEISVQNLINIAMFIDHEGRVMQIPVKEKKRLPVLQYVAAQLDAATQYTEQEINEFLRQSVSVDFMLMRRLLVDAGYLCRTANGASYWLASNIPSNWYRKERIDQP